MGSRFRPDDIWDRGWFDWTNELTNVTSTSSPGQFAPYPSEQRKLGTEATSHPKNRRRLGTRLKLLMIGLWYSNQSYVTPHVHLRWLNTVLRAVSGNSRDGDCFNLDKQTWRRKSNGKQKTISQNLLIKIL